MQWVDHNHQMLLSNHCKQSLNRITTADPDDPLTWTRIGKILEHSQIVCQQRAAGT